MTPSMEIISVKSIFNMSIIDIQQVPPTFATRRCGNVIIAGCGALGVAWLTVSVESIRAASQNPVESLRVE